MEPSLERVIEHIGRYTEAGDRLIERLQAQRAWNIEDIGRLRGGARLSESTKQTGSADRSRDLTRILSEFEQSRREIRTAVVAAAVDDGMTITEIADIFGVSRQLANRFVKEARAQGYLPEPPTGTG
jgi:hypothetical protein